MRSLMRIQQSLPGKRTFRLMLKANPGLVKMPVMVRGKTKTYRSTRWMRLVEEEGSGDGSGEKYRGVTMDKFLKEVFKRKGAEASKEEKAQAMVRVAKKSPAHAAFFLNNACDIAVAEGGRIGFGSFWHVQSEDLEAIVDLAISGGYDLREFREKTVRILSDKNVYVSRGLNLREFSVMKDPSSTPEELWHTAIRAWKNGTGTEGAIVFQEAIRDELLGGKGFIWQISGRERKGSAFELQEWEDEELRAGLSHPTISDEQKERMRKELRRREKQGVRGPKGKRSYHVSDETRRKLQVMVRKAYEDTQKSLQNYVLPKHYSSVFARAKAMTRRELMSEEEKKRVLNAIQDMWWDVVYVPRNIMREDDLLEVKQIAEAHKSDPSYARAAEYIERAYQMINKGDPVSTLTLYRGVTRLVVVKNVAESWTEMEDVAEEFTITNTILEEEIPISRVFLYYGCPVNNEFLSNAEFEYIVLSDVPEVERRKA